MTHDSTRMTWSTFFRWGWDMNKLKEQGKAERQGIKKKYCLYWNNHIYIRNSSLASSLWKNGNYLHFSFLGNLDSAV